MKLINVEDNADIRIDKYLINVLNISRTKIQKLIKDKKIYVNDEVVKNSYIIRTDDEIKIEDIIEEPMDIKPIKMDLDIVYEDEYLMVINKPSGLVVHPANGHYDDTLVNGIMYYLKSSMSRAGIVHRLDKDTSGLLLVAKDENTLLYLSEQLKQRKIKRIYEALVSGIILHDTGTIDAPIGRDKDNRQKMTVTELNSKNAITYFKVLKRFKSTTLLEIELETGRTHQIRVHMNYIRYPIINDPVYGKKINEYGQMLHAKTIGFIHPKTKKYMEFTKEPDDKFKEILKTYEEEQ